MGKRDKANKARIMRGETLQGVLAVLFFAGGLILIFASLGKAGSGGEYLYAKLTALVGVGFYLLPILALFLSAGCLRAFTPDWASLSLSFRYREGYSAKQ